MPALLISAALAAAGRLWSQWWPWASTRAAQIARGHAGLALGLAAAVVVVLLLAGWLRGDAAATAIAARDSTWKERLAQTRAADAARHFEDARRAAEAAAQERRDLEALRDREAERAAEIERQLEATRRATPPGDDPDPVIYPRNVARALRGDARK